MPRTYRKNTLDDYEITIDGQVINVHTGKPVNRENSLHALRNGWMRIEENHQFAKLDRESVSFIKSHPEMTRKELSEMFNISPHTISDIRTGRTWKTVEKIC